MKRHALIPYVATGVVMLGGAAIVSNPIVSAPADVRVPASELASSDARLDILNPDFLESIGAVPKGWPTAVATLNVLISELATNAAGVSPEVLADSLSHVSREDPAVALKLLTETSGPARDVEATAGGATDPTQSAVVVLQAISELSTDLRTGIGQAGAAFSQQVSMAPSVVLELTDEVLSGRMAPAEALRRLLATPVAVLFGNPALTGNADIDAVFKVGFLKPIIDAIERSGGSASQAADRDSDVENATADRAGTTAQPAPVNNNPNSGNGGVTLGAAGPTASAPSRPAREGNDGGWAADQTRPDGTPPSTSIQPGDFSSVLGEQLRKTLDGIEDTVKRLTGNGEQPKPPQNTRGGGTGSTGDEPGPDKGPSTDKAPGGSNNAPGSGGTGGRSGGSGAVDNDK